MEEARRQFLLERRSGIGGSDVASVLGLSKWKTPYQLYLEKTATGEPEEPKNNEILHFGNVLEQVVADEFCRRNNAKVQKRTKLYTHPQHPELIGHIDRYIVGGGILECKTADKFTRHLWGETDTDACPDYYLVQVQHYMHISGYHDAVLAVLIGGNEYRQYEIEYDKELADYSAHKCSEFWNNYVMKHVAPPATKNDDLADYYGKSQAEVAIATPHIAERIEALKELNAKIKADKDTADEISDEIRMFIGDANADTIESPEGKILATWKSAKDTVKQVIDWERIALECNIPQDIIAKFTNTETRAGTRRLILKK